jgi:hypothetical protein
MNIQELSSLSLSRRELLIFVVSEFTAVFGILVILQFLGLTYCAPFVSGVVAVIVSVAENLIFDRQKRKGS